MLEAPLMEAVGGAFTETEAKAMSEQPFESVPITVYDALPVGVIIMEAVVSVVLQE